jgi:PKHD-type hydroxylase
MRRFSVHTIPAFVPAESRAYERAQVFPAAFSDRQCQRIIEQANDLAHDEGHVGVGSGDTDDDVRRSRIAWIPATDSTTWIHDKLATIVQRANRAYGFDLIGFTEELQFTDYAGPGAHYTWHQDGLDGELALRKLSVVVHLSDPDDYDGGDLELFGIDDETWTETARGRGTAIVFPSFEHHRVTPIVSGTRRSLVCWVGGPPFR